MFHTKAKQLIVKFNLNDIIIWESISTSGSKVTIISKQMMG